MNDPILGPSLENLGPYMESGYYKNILIWCRALW